MNEYPAIRWVEVTQDDGVVHRFEMEYEEGFDGMQGITCEYHPNCLGMIVMIHEDNLITMKEMRVFSDFVPGEPDAVG